MSRVADVAAEGDVILVEQQIGSQLLSVDYNPDNRDVIRAYSADGRIFVIAAGNGAVSAGGMPMITAASDPRSMALHVGAHQGVVPAMRETFSHFGDETELSGWGRNVATSTTNGVLYPGATGPFENYAGNASGTSSASAMNAGALGQIEAVFEVAFGRRMGGTTARNRNAMLALIRESGTDLRFLGLGWQPNVGNGNVPSDVELRG